MPSFFGLQLAAGSPYNLHMYAKKLLEYFTPDLNDNSVGSPSTMVKWRDFLVEHAKFPFPETDENGAVNTTDISPYDVGLLEPQWKAEHAVRDSMLVQKLCRTLEDVVGEADVPNEREERLLRRFDDGGELTNSGRWSETKNDRESHSRSLLESGVIAAADECSRSYGGQCFKVINEHVAEGRSSVDYIGSIGNTNVVLIEAKSPSVMKAVCDHLPARGLKLNWLRHQPLITKIFQKAALYLGLRKMEWLFLTCHNSWVVFRLVSRDLDNGEPFLVYSPSYTIRDTSEPFRAFLGAIFSAKWEVSVQASILQPYTDLSVILKEVDEGPLPEDDIDDGSGGYRDHSRMVVLPRVPMTRSCVHSAGPGLMITSSAPHFPKSFQVWVHVEPLLNSTFLLPPCVKKGNERQHLWLTHIIGFGSTGSVWQCRFDDSEGLYAIKLIELLHGSDLERQRRFYHEFEAYLALETAYRTMTLRNHITPHCYGAFKGDGDFALVLELCDGALNTWDELNVSERTQVYGLVWDLHKIGIFHGDLEPRNVARVQGGFRLLDFSESRKHPCLEILGELNKPPGQVSLIKCPELLMMRSVLGLQAS